LGHGPFSHLWEGVVHSGTDKKWTHEQQSLQMIHHMMKSNKIRLDESSELHDKALRLITSFITGDCETWNELLQPSEMFLTEIVSNKFCAIDVDKCDYILRDTQHVKQHVEMKPFIGFLERSKIVYDDSGISHIGYHADHFELVENLFVNRSYLHMNIYQCHQVAAAEKMVKDICVKADAGGVEIAGIPLTEVHLNSEAFNQLDDSVLDLIMFSKIDNEFVDEARKILGDLEKKRLYKIVWESIDDDCESILETLVKKFGSIFTKVKKLIPAAEIPSNIPFYKDDGSLIKKESKLRLSYSSTIIYCVKPDDVVVNNVKNFIDSLNNNV
jgi:HD superfamily phosphohydrolase